MIVISANNEQSTPHIFGILLKRLAMWIHKDADGADFRDDRQIRNWKWATKYWNSMGVFGVKNDKETTTLHNLPYEKTVNALRALVTTQSQPLLKRTSLGDGTLFIIHIIHKLKNYVLV